MLIWFLVWGRSQTMLKRFCPFLTTYLPDMWWNPLIVIEEKICILWTPHYLITTLLNYRAAHCHKLRYYTTILSEYDIILMPCTFTGPTIFWAGPNFLCQTKNLIAFSATPKKIVSELKLNLLNAKHILVWHKKFWTGTTCKSTMI